MAICNEHQAIHVHAHIMILYLLFQYVASNDKLSFWLEIHSFVDYFTIPPAFVGIYLSRQWLGKYIVHEVALEYG